MVSGRDDAGLLVRLRQRDPQAIGLLYDRYGKAAYSLALRILGDTVWAEAVVAEAMIKCSNRIDSFNESRGSALGVWLLVTTYENALDHKRAADSRVTERSSQAGGLERPELFQDWSQNLDADRVQEAHAALRTFTKEEKQILDLFFFEGLNASELSARLEISIADIETTIQSAIRKLAAIP